MSPSSSIVGSSCATNAPTACRANASLTERLSNFRLILLTDRPHYSFPLSKTITCGRPAASKHAHRLRRRAAHTANSQSAAGAGAVQMQHDRQPGAVHKRQPGQVEHQAVRMGNSTSRSSLCSIVRPRCMMVQLTGVAPRSACPPAFGLRDLQHICHLEISKYYLLFRRAPRPAIYQTIYLFKTTDTKIKGLYF